MFLSSARVYCVLYARVFVCLFLLFLQPRQRRQSEITSRSSCWERASRARAPSSSEYERGTERGEGGGRRKDTDKKERGREEGKRERDQIRQEETTDTRIPPGTMNNISNAPRKRPVSSTTENIYSTDCSFHGVLRRGGPRRAVSLGFGGGEKGSRRLLPPSRR